MGVFVMADEERPFLIPVRRRWLLWILPSIAALYFLVVILLNILDYTVEGVSNDVLVLTGVALFVLVILVELPFFLRRGAERPAEQAPDPMALLDPSSSSSRNGWDDELIITNERQQGLLVVEYSSPAKSQHRNSVFTKTYVPVSGAHLLRIESLVADSSDL